MSTAVVDVVFRIERVEGIYGESVSEVEGEESEEEGGEVLEGG